MFRAFALQTYIFNNLRRYETLQVAKTSWVAKPECLEKTLQVRLRSTKTQSTYNTRSRSGGYDLWPLHQPDSLKSTARQISQLVTHPGLNFSAETTTGVSRPLVQALCQSELHYPFTVVIVCITSFLDWYWLPCSVDNARQTPWASIISL